MELKPPEGVFERLDDPPKKVHIIEGLRVTFSGTTLQIGEVTVETDQPVLNAVYAGGYVIVLLDPEGYGTGNPFYERNVMGYDVRGRAIWRIGQSQGGFKELGVRHYSPYTRVAAIFDGRFAEVSEVHGLDHDVVPETGYMFNQRIRSDYEFVPLPPR